MPAKPQFILRFRVGDRQKTTRNRVAYLLRAARSRHSRIWRTASGYFIADCNLELERRRFSVRAFHLAGLSAWERGRVGAMVNL